MTKFKSKILISVVLLLLSTHLWANTDKYRLTIRDNPATSVVIGWNQVSGSNPVVYYGKTDHGTSWTNYPFSSSPSRQVSYRGMNSQFVRLTGLDPNTAYYFVIRDSQGTSQRFWFKTAPDDPNQRLSFIAGGDSRNNRTPRINANKLVAKLRPHAVLFGGDMTANGTDSEWREWFDDWQYTIGSDGRMIPIVATRGNHESSNDMIYNLFDTPSSEVYYAITFGGNLIRTYTLNTEISISGNQTTWLQNDLAANSNITWKMAQYHKPMRPHVSSKAEGNNQYANWADLFYNNKVKLVVECDAHTVKTTWPVKPSSGSGSDEGFIRDDTGGTVYTGEGCWGAPLRTNNDNKSWTRNSASFNQFKWVFVDQAKIEVRTIKVDNANQVGQVSDNNIFTPPANLDIWNPSNGAVVTITNDSNPDGGEVTVSSRVNSTNDDVEEHQNGSMYMNSSDIELVYDGSRGNQSIGLRFQGLSIPQGATILSAHVQFTVDETNSGSSNLTIKAHDTDNAPAFSTSSYNVSSRPTTSESVNWSPSAWSSVGQAGSSQKTPDLKNIVQELVNRNGWSQSSALALVITGTGERTAEAYDGSSASAPAIYVTYSTDGSGDPSSPEVLTFAKGISNGNDDAEESSSGSMYLNSSDLELVYDSHMSAGNQRIGLRFTNVTIPQGATIEKAYVQFTVDETANTSGSKTIYGEATDHSGAFTSGSFNISNRPVTSAAISWNPPAWNSTGASGTDQRTSDISQIIQEIVNRSGWNPGNALSLILAGSGRRVAESYNGSSAQAPLLVIEYTSEATNARVASDHTATDNESTQVSPLQDRDIPVFPNPITDLLTIDLRGVEEEKIVMEIYSLKGERVMANALISNQSNRFNLEALPAGAYLLKVITPSSIVKQVRIIKY
ncbi:fibronectin type III domain-containing protein [Fulvivirga ulvae]|uniref:fibronectin type III domain-containing protein n=1 Tax=Fulvivirga ulvae TaxID=2904245 RepID=UPI001F23C48C|nr:fibronectin type III domain-containing protein [Fulvivirga ulvae]UII32648.1 fibronectin type III domain-containing protein [Fulvivirga ulvae]